MSLIKRLQERVLYVNHEAMFSVSRERFGDRYYLDVVCGGVGIFNRRLEMSSEEVVWLAQDLEQLKTLALQVCRWPERFEGRLCPH